MTEAAFSGTYADWRVIKGRKVVQIVFEVPLEAADQAYQVLGGMPIAAKEVWCGIARLAGSSVVEQDAVNVRVAGSSPARSANEQVSRPVSQAEKQPGSDTAPTAKPIRADKEKRSFGELAPAQQSGILCGERLFRLFLAEKFPQVWTITNRDPAAAVREICKVDSRADIKPDNADWSALVLSYRLWKNHPEYAA